jgi:membrane-bound lytic murein transglycosylase B
MWGAQIMSYRKIFRHLKKGIGIISLLLFSVSTLGLEQIPFSQRQDVHQFIQKMVKDYNFDEKNLNDIFNHVEIKPDIIVIMDKPAETWTWGKYQHYLITPARIQGGVDFWNKNAKTLAKVEKDTGVPANIIIAIIGIETFYGKNQGNYRVLDALATLAFEYPKRKVFFQNELKDYLLLARENQYDVMNLLGSYAGAIGQGQFMPSSYRQYAIHYYEKNGAPDLRNDANDVIASVANYLEKHGWSKNEPIAVRASVNGTRFKQLHANQLKPNYSYKMIKTYGVLPLTKIAYQDNVKMSFIILEKEDNKNEYWLTFHNFYVISRYNPRINYTMAVYQLSEGIKRARTLNHRR